MTVILAATAVVCGLLNLFIFQYGSWSLYVIGICVVLWIFFLPLFFGRIQSLCEPFSGWSEYCHVFWDHRLAASGQWMVFSSGGSHNRHSHNAHSHLCVLSQIPAPFHSFPGGRDRGEIAVLTVGIELLIHNYYQEPLFLSWSAVVLTCSLIIDGALITILRRSGLRNEVRRRMHI